MIYNDPILVAFNMLKIRYAEYDNDLVNFNCLTPESKVNLFINIESIFKIISTMRDCDNISRLTHELDVVFASDLLNLAGHYKRFFTSNGLNCKIYMYYTDPASKKYPEIDYNEDFRSYYKMKYTMNTKFVELFSKFKKKCMPLAKTVCDFIPGVYLIEATDFDASVLPLVIGSMDESRVNFIITNDLVETQYMNIDNYWVHCLQKKITTGNVVKTIPEVLSFMTRKPWTELEVESNVFNKYSYFITLLAVIGDKIRSVEPIKGVGVIGLKNMIDNARRSHQIPEEFDDLSSSTLAFIFPTPQRNEIISNIECLSLKQIRKRLTEGMMESIKSMIIDREDMNALTLLNQTRFKNHNIILENLL